MKALMKILLIVALYCLAVMPAKAGPLDSLQHKEMVQRGVAALKKVMAQNAWNESHGLSDKNTYVVRLDTVYIRQKEDAKGEGRVWKKEFISSADLQVINETLKSVNHAADNKKEFGVYVMVFNSYILNLTKAISRRDSIPHLLSLKKFAAAGDVDDIDKRIDDLNQEIWDQVGFTQNDFEVRVGVVYGREILLYNNAVHRVLAVTQAQGNGISSKKLQVLNANLKDVSSIGSPLEYLTTYPPALYKAFRAKTIPVKLKNKFKPSLNTYFSELADKAPKEYKDGGKDPEPQASRGVPVIDYSHGVKPEEMKDILKGINSTAAETGYDPKIFITSYVTPDEILKQVKDYVANPAGNKEIVIWVHIDADKSIQYEYGYGKDVPEQEDISAFAAILSKVLPELHGNPLADMFDAIAGLIGQAIVKPKYYDPEDPKYNPLPGLVVGVTVGNLVAAPIYPILKAIQNGSDEDKFTMTRVNFAFTVGLWNGTVEFIKGIASTLNMLSGGKEWDNMKEGLTKLGQLYDKEGISGVFGLFGKMIKDSHTGNPCKVSHTIGVDVINIASFYFAFAKTGTAAQIGKLMDAIDPLTYVMKGAGKLTKFAFTMSGKAAKGLYQVGKFVVRIHAEPLGPVLQWLDKATNTWKNFSNQSRVVMAMGDGTQLAVDPTTLNNVETGAYRFIEAVEDEGKVFRDRAGDMMVIVEHNGQQELALGRRVAMTIEQIDKLLEGFPNLKKKLEALGEDAKRAFVEEFDGDPAMMAKFEKAAESSKGLINPTLWNQYRTFREAATTIAEYADLLAKLKNLDMESQLRFFSQFGGDAAALKAFNLGQEVSMETWKVLSVAPNACKLMENQRLFHKLLTSPQAAKLGLDHAKMSQILSARALATKNVAEFATFRDDLVAFVDKFADVNNAKSVIANLAKEQRKGISYIGEEFVIYCLNRPEKLPFKPSDIIDFQFPIDGRDIDILTREGSFSIANELKSVLSFEKKYVTQLLKDFARVDKLGQFRWLLKKKGAYAGVEGMESLKKTVTAYLKESDIPVDVISKYLTRDRTKENFIKFVEDNFEKIFYIID
ncbi:hypothetical protein [Chitinophaga sp. sic0106]|uniref:hypothetical protein n=1 Tax=Chitinophaga sp. sic0106 TaxID=2854785 RepID=UPI001C4420CA|nr:hypothetical protein [Chitinophaga sp. sic0106]MBV7533739.1 hypothetical protein [Chitinophaga sp. sic0106]